MRKSRGTVRRLSPWLLIAAAACSSQPRDLDRLGALPPGVSLNIQESPYPVTGTTEEEIHASLRRGGPVDDAGQRFFGRFRWDMSARWQWGPTSRGCEMRDVEITVTGRLVMPRWESRATAPAEVRGQWDRFREALRVHEQGHYEHVARGARELHRRLMQLEVGRCAFMRTEARALHERILSRWKDVDREYDRETRHGRTQGAVWPPG